jgi:hypothetical protein
MSLFQWLEKLRLRECLVGVPNMEETLRLALRARLAAAAVSVTGLQRVPAGSFGDARRFEL